MMSSMPGSHDHQSLELVETSEFAELPAWLPSSATKFDAEAQPGFTVDWAIDDILGYDRRAGRPPEIHRSDDRRHGLYL